MEDGACKEVLAVAEVRMRSAREDGTILELNRDSFISTFHQESSRWSALLRIGEP